jgi:hypothetical protein
MFLGSNALAASKADNLSTICEPIVLDNAGSLASQLPRPITGIASLRTVESGDGNKSIKISCNMSLQPFLPLSEAEIRRLRHPSGLSCFRKEPTTA